MRIRTARHWVLATTAILPAMCVAAPSWAEDDETAGLERIVVTAERRETNLQTTAASVSAITAADFDRFQIEDLEDIDAATPSLRIDPNVASNNAVSRTLRGNSEANGAFLFSEPGVGLYLNGVYRRLAGGNLELADIERIEVIKGPQGTLFGRNTMSGAIS
ncbi:MAG: TonB-dependent receptor plug domain-containing protein, partial [Pseudomonadota bacterium]